MSDNGTPSTPALTRGLVLQAPITADDLPPVGPPLRTVVVNVDLGRRRLRPEEWALLADYMRPHPHLELKVRFTNKKKPWDLEFLAPFGHLTKLWIEGTTPESMDGLRHVPRLRSLVLLDEDKRRSLEVLSQLTDLRSLVIAGHSRELDVLGTLPNLRTVSLRGVKRDNLEFLGDAPQLASLGLDYGRIGDISALPALPNLKILGIGYTKPTDLTPISGCTGLVRLSLDHMPLSTFPDLSALTELIAVEAIELKGLENLSPLATAPNLRYLVVDSKTLHPDAFAVLANHPTLEYLDAGLKNDTLSHQPNQALDLPRDVDHHYDKLLSEMFARIVDS
ncbi:hypothetical protein AFM11_08115 [Mycolicibacterium wolinskyi]|uniref:Uncharacterized protein n=1 Tax=Mycolicibacterium wolinskyi TaxID=59750 RepID=A0A132PQN3_9MYCO|nr:hypothetical protein [Mycolicibacterium wolinskyi]KWX24633.1 hypothetical protein AFM11_08115 [Mycolicibacterium wolinskyi]